MIRPSVDLVRIGALAGLPASSDKGDWFPTGRTNLIRSIRSRGIATVCGSVKGSAAALFVAVSSLSEETQRTLAMRQCGMKPDQQADADQQTWLKFPSFTHHQQVASTEAAQRLDFYHARIAAGASKTAALASTASEHGVHASTIRRDLKRVAGAPRGDWPPLLARDYSREGRPKAEIDEVAWSFFTSYKRASSNQSWARCYRELKQAAGRNGWTIPSYKTLMRKVERDLSTAARTLMNEGEKALADLHPPVTRSVAHLFAYHTVNMDGRRADLFVEWEDGEVSRPIVIALQDVFSRKVLGWIVTKTENADDTKAMLLGVMSQWGRFIELRTDNSRAFAAKKISGGALNRFRWKAMEGELKGILPRMGVGVRFALPGNGRAKPIERFFLDLSDAVDRSAEFKGAYCGNHIDAKPEAFTGTPVPVALFREVMNREVPKHNAQLDRKTEMAAGKKSFDQVFDQSFAQQISRPLTAQQLRYFSYETVEVTPDRRGAVKHKGFTWWSLEHQELLVSLYRKKMNRTGFSGGSNFQVGWSHDEQNDEQVFA